MTTPDKHTPLGHLADMASAINQGAGGSELREQAITIATKYFMATSNDCVMLTDDISELLDAERQRWELEILEWAHKNPPHIAERLYNLRRAGGETNGQ